MKKDHTYYEKAWEESDGKCSRAARALGKYYFYVPDFPKSIEWFEKGLNINRLYPDTWFTLGCAYMKNEDFKGASFAFGSCISIDNKIWDAWGNLANCYLAQKKFFQAVSCCEQALAINKKNWRLLNNYIQFSIETL